MESFSNKYFVLGVGTIYYLHLAVLMRGYQSEKVNRLTVDTILQKLETHTNLNIYYIYESKCFSQDSELA